MALLSTQTAVTNFYALLPLLVGKRWLAEVQPLQLVELPILHLWNQLWGTLIICPKSANIWELQKMWLHTAQPLLTVGRLCCDIVKSENGMKKSKNEKWGKMKKIGKMWLHTAQPLLTVGRLCCDIVKSENGMKKVKMKKKGKKIIGKMWLHTAQPLLTDKRLCSDIVKSENGMKK